ncbi:MAG TPA: sugar phosphate isomerase/epimerase [Vicinamibacterales bacterium]|nr:sugar phosphate isomerase/epimerase [Vicinamibacterales bacterium]
METVEPGIVRAAAGEALSRREFVAVGAIGLLGFQQRAVPTIGVQSYSFRDRPLADAIVAMQQLGLRSCELWQAHVEPRRVPRDDMRRWRETTPLDVFHKVRDQFSKAGIALSAYNISIKDDFSDAEIARAFDMTKALGAPVITSSSNVNTVSRIAPVAERHGMLVGMHNHSRVDPNEFATAGSLTDAIAKGRYIAINLDLGHFTAANEDAVAFLERHHQRIVTVHIKDRHRDQGPNVPLGTGDTPLPAAMRMIRDRGWQIPMNLEYEYKGGDTLDEIRRMLDYCRRTLHL